MAGGRFGEPPQNTNTLPYYIVVILLVRSTKISAGSKIFKAVSDKVALEHVSRAKFGDKTPVKGRCTAFGCSPHSTKALAQEKSPDAGQGQKCNIGPTNIFFPYFTHSYRIVNTFLLATWDGQGTSYPPKEDKVYDYSKLHPFGLVENAQPRSKWNFFIADLARSRICLQILLQTCSKENLKGISSGSSKSVQTVCGRLSPITFILSGSEQPNPICLAVFIIGSSSGLIFTSPQQIVSQAIGSVPPIK